MFGLNLGEGNRVESNYIGLDPTGTSVVARADDTSENGIWLNGNGNVIGGTIPEHRNVISGWHQGIFNQFGGTNNRIIGNYFSTDKNGQNSFSSWSDLRIFFGDNHIGEPGAGNLIAGTLYLEGGNCTNNLIQGNSISRVVAAHGVNGNLIGGSANGASNTIVYVQFDSGPFNNKVQGNSIGFVNIFSFEGQFGGDSHHNLIGSDGDGMNDDAEGNVISGGTYNDRYGVLIYGGTGASSDFNEVRGNFIGVSPTGSILVEAPTGYGVQVSGGDSNLIENNVVGGWPVGVYIGDGDSNVVANNRIGTNNQGTQPLPNQVGVELGGSNSRLEHNLISANTKVGLIARGGSNVVAGNFVGTTADGLAALGNGVGIRVEGAATIGGTTPGMGNIVSGNLKEGIGFLHASGAVVQGNYIGVDSTSAWNQRWASNGSKRPSACR